MSTIDWPINNFELSKLLGLAETTIRVKQKQLKHMLSDGVDYTRADLGIKYAPTLSTVWHKSGAIKLALRCRSEKARLFLESEEILNRVEVADESRTIEIICEAIKGFTKFRQQYPVGPGPYIIDIYLPDLKMAVECDERGHAGYSKLKEYIREQFIVEQIGCHFKRYDPAYPSQVGQIINAIFKAIRDEVPA